MDIKEIKQLLKSSNGVANPRLDMNLPSILSSIIDEIPGGGGDTGGGMTKVTHDELVSLRDEGKLTPGALYRITDYVATTAQEGTSSANHPFDIVVVALDEKTLSEDAGAIVHSEEDLAKYKSVTWPSSQMDPTGSYIIEVEQTAPFLMETNITMQGDTILYAVFTKDENTWVLYNPQKPDYIIINLSTGDVEKSGDGYVVIGSPELESSEDYTIDSGYFANSNLPAWQLKYCLDNDTDRFAWAQHYQPPIENRIGITFEASDADAVAKRFPEGDGTGVIDGQEVPLYKWVLMEHEDGSPYDITDPNEDWDDNSGSKYATTSETPANGDKMYQYQRGTWWYWGNYVLSYHDDLPGRPEVPEGKGVVYWMKDEHDNEAPFDFKGITFSLQNVASSEELQDFVNNNTPLNIEESDYQVYWLTALPTSTADVIEDMSTGIHCCYGNVNKRYDQGFIDLMMPSTLLVLPKNIMLCYDYGGYGNPVTCIDNSFGENCGGNIVAPTPIGIKLLGANAGNGVFAVNSYGMYATIYPILSNETIYINNNNVHVGRDSNDDVQKWNPADLVPQQSTMPIIPEA